MGSRKLIILSIGLNILLLTVFIFRGDVERTNASPGNKVRIERKTVVEIKTNAAKIKAADVPFDQFHWRNLESPDYNVYIANLRSIGCPERTLEHIILEDLEKLYREKQKAEPLPQKLWLTGPERDAMEQQRRTREHQLQEEKRETIKILLGREIDREARKVLAEQADAGWFLSFLTDEKAEQVLTVGHRLGEEMSESFKGGEEITEGGFEHAQKVYEQMMAEFRRIGTEQEVEEGRLRMSLALYFVSGKTKSLRLSGQELRNLISLQMSSEDPFQKIMELLQRGLEPPKPRPPECIASVRQLLGEQRFTEWICAQDEDINRFRKATQKVASPPETVVKFFEVQQAALAEAQQIRENKDLSRAEKRTELRALQEMSKQAVTELFGSQCADEYFKTRAIWWERLRTQ